MSALGLEGILPEYPTDEQMARAQAALARAYAQWAEKHDDDFLLDPPDDARPTDYAVHQALVEASEEALLELAAMQRAELEREFGAGV